MAPKRKHGSDAHDITASTEERQPKRFAMLKPRIRHIAEHTIKTKWVTLPESAQNKVDELFHSIERPVITRHRDEKKRIEVQTALAAVRRKYVCALWLS
jgi:kinetochore protein Fta7